MFSHWSCYRSSGSRIGLQASGKYSNPQANTTALETNRANMKVSILKHYNILHYLWMWKNVWLFPGAFWSLEMSPNSRDDEVLKMFLRPRVFTISLDVAFLWRFVFKWVKQEDLNLLTDIVSYPSFFNRRFLEFEILKVGFSWYSFEDLFSSSDFFSKALIIIWTGIQHFLQDYMYAQRTLRSACAVWPVLAGSKASSNGQWRLWSAQTITKTRLFKYIENFTIKNWKFSHKNSDVFHISAQNIDCGYEYPQSVFLSRSKKNNSSIYTCKPEFTI